MAPGAGCRHAEAAGGHGEGQGIGEAEGGDGEGDQGRGSGAGSLDDIARGDIPAARFLAFNDGGVQIAERAQTNGRVQPPPS